ncbi:MAG: peptide ABC transporter substrate-binding protein [Clostridia bacterium]|nr:peptide ABC transporter substrate-binding protein [Clostridia bacterium]
MLKKTLCLLVAVLLSFTLFGCDSAEDKYILYIELDTEPTTLDPQLASGISEEMIVRNMFEGLTRIDEEGKVVPGAAEKIEASADGLVYTFTLNGNSGWSNGDRLTADDFVFGLERAVDPKISAPSASLLYSIKNARNIAEGGNEKLGVTAVSENVLQIVLSEPDNNFLKKLSSAVAMPCNRKAFKEAKGKYGMNEDEIVSNGSFSMYYWDKQDDFRLRILSNEYYEGRFKAEASSVVFSVGDFASRDEKLEKNSIDMGFVDSTVALENSKKYEFSKTGYGLLINSASAFGKEEFKKAIMSSINRDELFDNLLPGLDRSDVLIPQSLKLSNTPISELCSTGFPKIYNAETARSLYMSGVDKYGAPGTMVILHHKNEGIRQLAMEIATQLQHTLGVVVNLEEVNSNEDLTSRIAFKEYSLAIAPYTDTNGSATNYLLNFVSENKSNMYQLSDKGYDELIKSVSANISEDNIVDLYNKAIKIINDEYILMPLVNNKEAFGYANIYSCPVISPFDGIIDLALVKK